MFGLVYAKITALVFVGSRPEIPTALTNLESKPTHKE